MPMSEEEIKKLAKATARETVKAFFEYIDLSLGKSMRKKLVYLFIGLLIAGGIATGIIHLPKGLT